MARFWLSYDLSNPNVYESLYIWIARHGEKAAECGGTTVTFLYDGDFQDLKTDFKEKVKGIEKEKIYVIYKDDRGKTSGRFMFGKRNLKNPWDRYLVQEQVEEDS